MDLLSQIHDRFRGRRINENTEFEIKDYVASIFRCRTDEVDVEIVNGNVVSVNIKQRPKPIRLLGEYEPMEYSLDAADINNAIENASRNFGNPDTYYVNPRVFGDVLGAASSASSKSISITSSGNLSDISWISKQLDQAVQKTQDLQARIKELEERNYELEQDIEQYKMLAGEN